MGMDANKTPIKKKTLPWDNQPSADRDTRVFRVMESMPLAEVLGLSHSGSAGVRVTRKKKFEDGCKDTSPSWRRKVQLDARR